MMLAAVLDVDTDDVSHTDVSTTALSEPGKSFTAFRLASTQ